MPETLPATDNFIGTAYHGIGVGHYIEIRNNRTKETKIGKVIAINNDGVIDVDWLPWSIAFLFKAWWLISKRRINNA